MAKLKCYGTTSSFLLLKAFNLTRFIHQSSSFYVHDSYLITPNSKPNLIKICHQKTFIGVDYIKILLDIMCYMCLLTSICLRKD